MQVKQNSLRSLNSLERFPGRVAVRVSVDGFPSPGEPDFGCGIQHRAVGRSGDSEPRAALYPWASDLVSVLQFPYS